MMDMVIMKNREDVFMEILVECINEKDKENKEE